MPLYPSTGRISGSGFPKSGTTGTGVNAAVVGTIYRDTDTGVEFVNEGTAASPYWTVMTPDHPRVLSHGWLGQSTDDVAVADTSTEFRRSTMGVIIAGLGLDATDAGATQAVGALQTTGYGHVIQLITDNVDGRVTGMLPGTNSVATNLFWQPDIHGTMVVDAVVTQKTAITTRNVFCGFCSTLAAAFTPIVTGSGTTISFSATQGDDVAGLYFDTDLTATDRWYFPYDKNNTNASIATTATGVDTGITVAAAATYQRLRVEVWADGQIRAFINKAQVSAGPGAGTAALDVDEELTAVLYVGANDTATSQMDVARFHVYGQRPVMP